MPKLNHADQRRQKCLQDLESLRDARAGSFVWHLVEAADSKSKREYAQALHSSVCTMAKIAGYDDLREKLTLLANEALERGER
jgi:hypothetical protein